MTIDVRTMTTHEIVKNHYHEVMLSAEVVESTDPRKVPTMRDNLLWLTTVSELWVSDSMNGD
jgi:hypothetical protein